MSITVTKDHIDLLETVVGEKYAPLRIQGP
jgi:hypothetical protein